MNKLVEWAKALRIVEILGKLGFVLVGALFAISTWSWDVVFILLKISFYSFICGLTIFCFNSYSGYDDDKANERLSALFNVSKFQWLLLTVFFTVTSLVLILFHPFIHIPNPLPLIYIALAVLLCWGLYTMPKYGLKGIPLGGILISFLTELLLFHLSYLFFAPLSFKSIAISCYFGFLVAAGHALHELIDYDADKEAGIRTTAVYLGFEKAKYVPFLIFVFAFLLLIFYHFPFLSFPSFLMLGIANSATIIVMYGLVKTAKDLHFLRKMYLTFYAVALLGKIIELISL